jgi:hypothetical protein
MGIMAQGLLYITLNYLNQLVGYVIVPATCIKEKSAIAA